jgi:hypothetical protein
MPFDNCTMPEDFNVIPCASFNHKIMTSAEYSLTTPILSRMFIFM